MRKEDSNFSMAEAAKLARSREGQQLLALLKKENSSDLQKAMDAAAAGDYAAVRNTLQTLMATPEAQALMKRMGGGRNG